MLKVKTEKLELRGIDNRVSNKGNAYCLLNCELSTGEPVQFYCGDFTLLPQGLKKGDMLVLTLEVSKYNNNINFKLFHVEHCK